MHLGTFTVIETRFVLFLFSSIQRSLQEFFSNSGKGHLWNWKWVTGLLTGMSYRLTVSHLMQHMGKASIALKTRVNHFQHNTLYMHWLNITIRQLLCCHTNNWSNLFCFFNSLLIKQVTSYLSEIFGEKGLIRIINLFFSFKL